MSLWTVLRIVAPLFSILLRVVAEDGKDAGQGGYGDAMQGGYGGDGGQGGYGEQLQQQLLNSNPELKKPVCPPGSGTTAVTKRGFQMFANTKMTETLQEKYPEFSDALKDCILYGNEICLMICGMTAPKCDTIFKKCMSQACKSHTNSTGCNKVANEQSAGTAMFSQLGWKAHQTNACECVSDGQLAQRRKEELTTFYEKWAPEQIGKVDKLAKKYADNWPMLMLTLHQKYTDSVELKKEEEKKEDEEKKVEFAEKKDDPEPETTEEEEEAPADVELESGESEEGTHTEL